MKLIIISGRSGSGKTHALNILEDLGYYCIDNLPLSLLPVLSKKLHNRYQYVAVSIDARNITDGLGHFSRIIETLKENFDYCEIIFLDAEENTLLKRFSETRRKHPLTTATTSLKEALQTELSLLQPILDQADLRIDTSHMNIHELKKIISDRICQKESNLSLMFQSFGYKHGVPTDTDFIFDVRCLPNPYWEKQLRALTGQDIEVIEFLQQFSEVNNMYNMIKDFIESWLSSFEAENRKYLTVSLGCTGGKHRSVYLIDRLANYFSMQRSNVVVRHRDKDS